VEIHVVGDHQGGDGRDLRDGESQDGVPAPQHHCREDNGAHYNLNRIHHHLKATQKHLNPPNTSLRMQRTFITKELANFFSRNMIFRILEDRAFYRTFSVFHRIFFPTQERLKKNILLRIKFKDSQESDLKNKREGN